MERRTVKHPHTDGPALSRRGLLRGAAFAAGGGALLAASAASAQSKVSQKLAQYQGAPKGTARCDGCQQWAPPSGCKVVEGKISPSGWCVLFAPKG
jgi:hypothetical protein